LRRSTRRSKITAANAQLTELVNTTRNSLQQLNGIGPSGAARLLGDVGDITRFASRGHLAAWNGTAPLDASSGDQKRHRLSRAGNRRINRVLHIMAIVQLRNDTEGRAYYRRKVAAGKTNMEALRCLKRRLSDVVYKQMFNDARYPIGAPDIEAPAGVRDIVQSGPVPALTSALQPATAETTVIP
jgi:transposase